MTVTLCSQKILVDKKLQKIKHQTCKFLVTWQLTVKKKNLIATVRLVIQQVSYLRC